MDVMERVTLWLSWASVVGVALMAGTFFGFSSLMMPALARLPAAQGVAAMQSVCRVALHKPFFWPFVGTGLTCLFLAVLAIASWADVRARYRFAGCIVFLIGSFIVTGAANVPRNEALEALDPSSAEAASYWVSYLSEWTAWNHARTIAAVAALVLLILSRLMPAE